MTIKNKQTDKMQVVMKKVSDLIPNKLSDMLGDASKKENYLELLASIALCGIQQPLIIDANYVRKGNKRLQCCKELGITKVPCIQESDYHKLEAVRLSTETNIELVDNYKTFVLGSYNKQTVLAKLLRLETLTEVYGIRQGIRADLDDNLAIYIKKRDTIGSTSTRTQLKQLRKYLEKALPGKKQEQNDWIKEQGPNASLKILLIDARRLAANGSNRSNGNNQSDERDPKNEDYINGTVKIFNQSCFDLSVIPDGTVQNLVTSPPYAQARPKQEGIDNSQEIGTEKDVETYAERLVQCFVQCIPKLTADGTIWVILADNMRDGSFKGAPELFLTKMLKAGFKCCDKIYWVKTSAQPGDGDNSFQNVEYILKFSVCDKPYTNYEWLNETNNFDGSTFGKDNRIKLSSFINLKKGFVITSPASTAKLRKACEEAGFYLEHTSTYLPEIPYMCIKLSSKPNTTVLDIFNGCGNTAVAAQYANMGLNYIGIEINSQSVKASKVNLEKVHGFDLKTKEVDFKPDYENDLQKAA